MTYIDRLQKSISLTSPTGQVFEAKWSGNERSNVKKLGIFNTPGVRGTISQDLEVEGNVYPLTIYFDGPDNDLTADSFFTACAEKGKWTVVHPVHGTKTLQLVDYSESVQPVTSGNVTTFTTNWLETIEVEGVQTNAQLSSLTVAQNNTLLDTSKTQFDNIVSQDTADKIGKLKTSAQNTVSAFNSTLKGITDTVADVQAQADSITRGINDTLSETVVDTLALAGQIQALVQLPNLVATDLNSKIDTYKNFASRILGDSPETPLPSNINAVAVQECALTAAIGAVGVGSVLFDHSSRACVIDTIEDNIELLNTITTGLDDVQEVYKDELIGNSYFSQSESYGDSARLSALALAYLIRSAFNLAIEKRIILTEDENPVMIAMREYGGPGENDINIDLFIASNQLEGNDILILPAGREVVVYV